MLAPHEADAVIVERPEAVSPFVISCDHAGRLIPEALGDLGLEEAERSRHIAWDIGALGVASALAETLGAPLVAQRYSRLVVDCNRPPHHPDLVPVRSEATHIPGNASVTHDERRARLDAIYEPYHAALRALLDAREARGLPSVFVAIHSFTPVYHGEARPWHVGVLYGEDRRLADPLLDYFAGDEALCVGDNEPYKIDDADHGIPEHGLRRGIAHALLEIRQDLVERESGQRAWSSRIAVALERALAGIAR